MFNEKQIEGLRTGKYVCEQCGAKMIFEDEKERDVLVCTNSECSYSTDLDHYGFTDEEYEAQYPSKEDICGYDEK